MRLIEFPYSLDIIAISVRRGRRGDVGGSTPPPPLGSNFFFGGGFGVTLPFVFQFGLFVHFIFFYIKTIGNKIQDRITLY